MGNWREQIKLPSDPKEADLAIKLDVNRRKLRVTGKNPPKRTDNLQYFRGPRNTGIKYLPTKKDEEEKNMETRWAKVIQIPEDVDLRTLLYHFLGNTMSFNAQRELPDFEHVPVDVFSYSTK